MIESIKEAQKMNDFVIERRQELHAIPELDYDLFETAKVVKRELDDSGIPYETMAKTGIVALIEGEQEGGTIGIRADMDALPIKEETGLPYASTNDNMHACGHDAHTAILITTAKILANNKDKIKGNVKLFFQPAEESLGGAKPMIEEGAMENPKVDAVTGLHVSAEGKKPGDIIITPGPAMAAVDIFNITIKGKGAHAASPHLSVDPVLIACELVSSLQKIISREISPLHNAVVTVGEIKGGSASNIIPESVHIQGTVRTLDQGDREHIEKRIKDMTNLICEANRATAEIDYLNHFPICENDIEFAGRLETWMGDLFEEDEVHINDIPTLGAEDMAYFLEQAPGTYFNLKTTNEEKGITYPGHHPKFDVDEEVLWRGVAAFLEIVNRWQD